MSLILDRKGGISLTDAEQSQFSNELNRVGELLTGIQCLYTYVTEMERRYRKVVGETSGVYFGNTPGLPEAGVNLNVLSCMFEWYSISACKVFHTVGHIAERLSKPGFAVPTSGKDYRKRVCGAMLVYRNKIAAHYAFVDPRSDDNAADLALSALPSISLVDGRLETGAWSFSLGDATSKHEYGWSLTSVHENEVLVRFGAPVKTPPQSPQQ